MTQPAPPDAGWVARVAKAGVRVELFNTVDSDDYYLEFQASIVTAARTRHCPTRTCIRCWRATGSGDLPSTGHPTRPLSLGAARSLSPAGPARFELDGGQPSDRTRQLAEEAVIEDLQLTPRELLAVLADHWQPLARRQVPSGWQYSLLDIARQLLREPVAGACIVLWSTLQQAAVMPAAGLRRPDAPAGYMVHRLRRRRTRLDPGRRSRARSPRPAGSASGPPCARQRRSARARPRTLDPRARRRRTRLREHRPDDGLAR